MSVSLVSISEWLTNWCKQAKVSPRNVLFTLKEDTIYIVTDQPGWLIGVKGSLFEDATKKLNDLCEFRQLETKLKIQLIEATRADYCETFDPMAFCF